MEPEKNNTDEPQIKTFAYYMAWFAFLASAFSLIVSVVKDLNPPQKDDYKK